MSQAQASCWWVPIRQQALVEAQAIATAWLNQARVAPRLAQRILLSLDELVANLVEHATPAGASALFELRLVRDGDLIILVMIDEGAEFDPVTAAVPAPAASLADLAVGGRGLLLVRQLARSATYRREGGRNRVTLEFTPAQSAPVPD